jgi:riboflavin synthase
VDGVSLTVNSVAGNIFSVNIIPHTSDVTIMGDYQVGSAVNVEVDVLARYIERLIDRGDSGLTMEFLRTNGYV